jgi:hypothetical protein
MQHANGSRRDFRTILNSYLAYCYVYVGTRDYNDGFLLGLDLLELWLQSLLIIFNTALSLIYTIYSLLLHTH